MSAGLSEGRSALLQLQNAGTGMATCTAAVLPANDVHFSRAPALSSKVSSELSSKLYVLLRSQLHLTSGSTAASVQELAPVSSF